MGKNRKPRLSLIPRANVDNNYLLEPYPEVSESTTDTFSSYERIVSDDDPSRSREWKPVEHIKCTTTSHAPNLYEFRTHAGQLWRIGEYYSPFNPWDYIEPRVTENVNKILVNHPPDWDRTLQKVLPSLRNQFNTINALVELGDFKQMASQVIGLSKKAREFKYIYDRFDRYRDPFLTDPTKPKLKYQKYSLKTGELVSAFVDGSLSYQLGYKPLLGDISTVMLNCINTLVGAHDNAGRISKAIKSLSKFQTSTSKDFDGDFFFTTTGRNGQGEYVQTDIFYRVIVRRHVSFGLDFGIHSLAQFLDYAGIYPDLSTLWNAVPFSFLFDYVVPVGAALEKEFGNWSWQTVGKMDGGVRLQRAMTSVTVNGSFRHRYGRYSDGFPGKSFSVSHGKGEDTRLGDASGRFRYYTRILEVAPELDGRDFKVLPSVSLPHQQEVAMGMLVNGYQGVSKKSSKRRWFQG